jgi:hypothetical protein
MCAPFAAIARREIVSPRTLCRDIADRCEPRGRPWHSAREAPRTASAAPRPVCAPLVAAIARREIVSPRTLAVSALSLDTAASTDALQRHLPGVLHRHGWSSTSRITRAELAARNRLADFRLRCALAALPRRPAVHTAGRISAAIGADVARAAITVRFERRARRSGEERPAGVRFASDLWPA